jgi:competence protein ComEA
MLPTENAAPIARDYRLAAVAAVALAVLAGLWFGSRGPESPPLVLAPAGPAAAGVVTVHVSGAVRSPGLVEIAQGGRVADALAAAGGALPEAGLSSLNLAAPVVDGQQIVVALPGEDPVGPGADQAGGVRINAAGLDDMQRLPGVGPVLASRIIAFRDEHGPFRVAEDLLDVPGIGEAKLAALRDAVILP